MVAQEPQTVEWSISPSTLEHTHYADAGNTGWGCAYLTHRAHDYWTTQEAHMSINWRELKAAFLALQAFPHLANTTVLIRTDNTTSLAYINKQGCRVYPISTSSCRMRLL